MHSSTEGIVLQKHSFFFLRPLANSSLSLSLFHLYLIKPSSSVHLLEFLMSVLRSYALQPSFSNFLHCFPVFSPLIYSPPSALRPLSAPSVTNCLLSSLDNLQNETEREGRRVKQDAANTRELWRRRTSARKVWRTRWIWQLRGEKKKSPEEEL